MTIKRGKEELVARSIILKSGGEEVIEVNFAPIKPPAPPRGGSGTHYAPLDDLQPEDIPAAERFDWQPQEMVQVLGSHAWRHWGDYQHVPGPALAFSDDGKQVIVIEGTHHNFVGSGRNELRIWDAATGRT